MAELILGTAQFGLDYGITNSIGQTSDHEIEKVAELSKSFDIRKIDTAKTYGESEDKIGKFFDSKYFQVISKLKIEQAPTMQQIEYQFNRLGYKSIYGLLIHETIDPENTIHLKFIDFFRKIRDLGLVSKIGISVYNEVELSKSLDVFPDVDIIQVPANIFDLDFINGSLIKDLRQGDVEIHARSIFLQGLLISSPHNLPDRFSGLKSNLLELDEICQRHNISRLQLLLSAIKFNNNVSGAVVGISTSSELREIGNSWIKASKIEFQLESKAPETLLDPRLW
jgi:aryl-alcohol dehydrogenase-like predicted oxidoreductase